MPNRHRGAYKRGTNLGEGYNDSKAKEDQILTDARRNTGAMGVANSLLGGGVVGGGLSSAGVTTRRLLSSAPLSLGCTATSAADAAALGGVDAVQNGLVRQKPQRSGGSPQTFQLRSKRNAGAALTAAAGNERRRAHPRDAFDKRDRLPIQRSGIAREPSSEQPLQGNEGRKDKRDDTGEGDGKVKVMHDDQRLLQTRSGLQNLTLHRLPIRPHIGAASAAGTADEVRPDIRQPDVISRMSSERFR